MPERRLLHHHIQASALTFGIVIAGSLLAAWLLPESAIQWIVDLGPLLGPIALGAIFLLIDIPFSKHTAIDCEQCGERSLQSTAHGIRPTVARHTCSNCGARYTNGKLEDPDG